MRASDQNCMSRDESSHERVLGAGCKLMTYIHLLIVRDKYSCWFY